MPERISGPIFTIFPDGSQTNNSPLAALFTVRGGGNKIRGNNKRTDRSVRPRRACALARFSGLPTARGCLLSLFTRQ